jgi:hypothetical protein
MRPAEWLTKIIEIVNSASNISSKVRMQLQIACRIILETTVIVSCSKGKTISNYSKFERKNCKGKGVSCSLE